MTRYVLRLSFADMQPIARLAKDLSGALIVVDVCARSTYLGLGRVSIVVGSRNLYKTLD
jgi:hypothetical protein